MKKQITKDKNGKIVIIQISTENSCFSITGGVYSMRGGIRRLEYSGCVHDDILEVAPELKPFVDLHLSTLDGVPMHSEENGFYWLAKAAGIPQKWEPEQSPMTCEIFFMNHARMTGEETHELIEKVKTAYQKGKNSVALSEKVSPRTQEEQQKVGAIKARAVWSKAIDGLRPRWKSEADSALLLLESL